VLCPDGFLSAVWEGLDILGVLLSCGEGAVQELSRQVAAGELQSSEVHVKISL